MEELLSIFADMVAERVFAKMQLQQLPTDEGLVTRKQALDELNITETTLWRWQHEGRLHPVKIGRKVYFKKSELYGTI